MRRAPVTWILIGLNVTAFLVTGDLSGMEFDGVHMIRFGADVGALTLGGQWWRLITSMFLHFSFFHIASNMVCLFFLGRMAERTLGSWVFLSVYVIVGVAGSLVSGAVHPLVVGAGASGAVFGIAGVLLPVFSRRRNGPAWTDGPAANGRFMSVAKFSVYNLIYSFAPGIDATAHFGGFAAGIALGIALQTPVASPLSSRRLSRSLVTALVLLTGGAVWARGFRRSFLATDMNDLSSIPDPSAAVSAAPPDAPALERRLHNAPDSASLYVALATADGDAGNIQEAVAVLRRGVRRMPRNVELLTALGSAELNTGDYTRAVVAFDRALVLAPGSADLRYDLATALFDRAEGEVGRPAARDSATADVRRVLGLPADTSSEMLALQLAARQLLAK